jgi:DMSO/TMAO reductase YedYZ heme-binding membrane subunit
VNAKAYWYLTRSTGVVSLALLTATMVLGVLQYSRWASPRLPRFVTAGLHRNLSLLAVAFLAVHVTTAIVDSFAPISVLDAFIPFRSHYRPLWLGFGALALDLLAALVVTSLLRTRLGYRTWRAVHWLAYACWPVALVHGLGTGSDDHLPWFLGVTVACGVAVVAATVWRIAESARSYERSRALAFGAVAAVVAGIVAWTAVGPLQPGWARRAGTPTSLLTSQPAAARTPEPNAPVATVAPASLTVPFDAGFTGTLREDGPDAAGLAIVVIDGHLRDGATGRVHVVLQGPALGGGGVQMDRSRAYLGPLAVPSLYAGSITDLAGSRLVADLRAADGHRARLTLALDLNGSTAITGRAHASKLGDD